MTWPLSPVSAACTPSARRTVAVCGPPAEDEKRTRYAMSATASPFVSILSSYHALGASGPRVVDAAGVPTPPGSTVMIRLALSASLAFGLAQNVWARVFGDGDMLATTPASLTPTQVGRATSGLVSASTSTAPTAGSNHRARTERYSSSAKNRSRFALDGNVSVNTRLIRVFGPFSTRATTKSQPKAPPWRARIGAIALRYCV